MVHPNGKRAAKPVATLELYHRKSVDAPFEKAEQAIDIFPRDDFYFGRSSSWYLQYTT